MWFVDVLEDDDSASAGEQVARVGQRPPLHRRQRTTVHRVAGHLLEHVEARQVHRGVHPVHDVGQLRQPLLLEQHRAHPVAGVEGPPDDLLPLRDEQPFGRFAAGAQGHVGQPDVVVQLRVVGARDPPYGTHLVSPPTVSP